jgi:protein ImuA
VFVSAPDANAAFWATEEALKSGAPAAVVAEIWSLKGYGLIASRRLLLAARKGGTPALLVLASAYGQAEKLSTAATTRFEIAAAPSARSPAAAGRDLPGPFACAARLVKARATAVAAVDSPSSDGRSDERPMDRGGGLSEAALQADQGGGVALGAIDSPSTDGRSDERPMDRAAAVHSPSIDGRPSGRPLDRGYRARLQGLDPTRAVRLEWRNEERRFDDTVSLALAAASGDRPRAASS